MGQRWRTQKELDIAKTTLTGSYRVGFDTTGGLAGGILSAVVDWGDLSYVDNQPDKINAVTLDEVNNAIKTYISVEDLYQVAAGSVDENGEPLEKE